MSDTAERVLAHCPIHGKPVDSHCNREAGCMWDKCPEGCVIRQDGHVMGTPTPEGNPARGPLL